MAAPRLVQREELPASVLDIPIDFNPLEDGVLMDHQASWIADDSPLKLCEKGRRTGITWAEAQDDALIAAASALAGGDNVFYIGDSKEKGLEFVGYCAHLLGFVEGHSVDIWETEEVVRHVEEGEEVVERVAAYTIRCKSGKRISALASRPAVIRGLQGVVVIDEAAFHRNVRAVIEACLALLIWGGRIRIISTHNGVLNAFNELINETRAGKTDYSLHRYTFDDAVRNGLYERMCLKTGETPTPDGKARWYRKVRGGYGTRVSIMKQELDAIPAEGEGRLLPFARIDACMDADYVVKRWKPPREDFVDWPQDARRATVQLWLEREVAPALERFPERRRTALGGDFGMRQDRSVFAVGFIDETMRLHAPLVVELWRVPYDQQKQVLFFIIERLHRFQQAILDANGNGMVLAQEARQRFGQARVTELMPSDAWLREFTPVFQSHFEDKTILVPKDDDIRGDLALMEMIDGVGKVPRDVRTDGSAAAGGGKRHGDAAVALLNLTAASRSEVAEYGYAPARAGDRPDPWGERGASWEDGAIRGRGAGRMRRRADETGCDGAPFGKGAW